MARDDPKKQKKKGDPFVQKVMQEPKDHDHRNLRGVLVQENDPGI
jgi:hypothetical protein